MKFMRFFKNKKKEKEVERTLKHILFDLYDIFSFLIFVSGIVLFARFFLFQPFTVVGESMVPNIQDHDFLLIGRWYNNEERLHRGDVIVFVPPTDDTFYVKRVIWFPGELVKLEDGNVFICDSDSEDAVCKELDESYLPDDFVTNSNRCGIDEFLVDEKWLFVLGDNRNFSTDSRCCFTVWCYDWVSYEVPFENIVGKVVFRLFPQIGTI